ncbi:unnamed protein product [Phytophthora fragariaefolia]|uniref:Unnamed protein product n=1 Tax=Phytophthora fragariaefolia TaxID=1490495 RepID=A0A9W6Y777_9STRA|nr:unnamed protein product [Phytophthora fragariaefolia]
MAGAQGHKRGGEVGWIEPDTARTGLRSWNRPLKQLTCQKDGRARTAERSSLEVGREEFVSNWSYLLQAEVPAPIPQSCTAYLITNAADTGGSSRS